MSEEKPLSQEDNSQFIDKFSTEISILSKEINDAYTYVDDKFNERDKDIKFQNKLIKDTRIFVGVVLVVCVLAFFGFLYDHLIFHSDLGRQPYYKLKQIEKSCNCHYRNCPYYHDNF